MRWIVYFIIPGLLPQWPEVTQPISTPDSIDRNQTSLKTGVLTGASRAGKKSGYRTGGWMTGSKMCAQSKQTSLRESAFGRGTGDNRVTHQRNRLVKCLWTLEWCVRERHSTKRSGRAVEPPTEAATLSINIPSPHAALSTLARAPTTIRASCNNGTRIVFSCWKEKRKNGLE